VRRNSNLSFLALCIITGWALAVPASVHAAPIPKDSIFATDTNDSGHTEIWRLQEGQDPAVYATINPGTTGTPWVGPLAFGPNGHLYVASIGENGTLWDVTAGGDLSADKPVAKGLFKDAPQKLCGLVFDAAGNAYLSLSEAAESAANRQPHPIVRVDTKTGSVTELPVAYDHARGLAIATTADKKEILYIVEAGTGRVLSYNLTDNQPGDKPLATGFPPMADHVPGSIALDPRGHLFVLWRMNRDDANTADENSGGLFDITNGGDFSDVSKTPPLVKTQFRMDVNQMAFDSQNYLYLTGNDSKTVWVSPFQGDVFFQALAFAVNVGNCDAIAIAP
jgi:glucose/arabinose dehydrogenase